MPVRTWTTEELAELVRGSTANGRDLRAQSVPLPDALTTVTRPEPDAWDAQIGQEHPSDHGTVVANWHRAVAEPGVVHRVRGKRRLEDQWFEADLYALSLLHQAEFGFVLSFVRLLREIDPPADTRADDAATYTTSHSIIQHLDEVGLVLVADGEVEHVFGRPAETLRGRAVTDHFHPDDLDAAIAMWIEILATPGGTRTLQHRVVKPDGSVVWLQSLVMNHLDTDGFVLVISHDVGAQRNQQVALRTSEQALRFLTEAVPVAVFQATSAGTLTFGNARWGEALGDVATFDDVLATIQDDDRALLVKALTEAKSSRTATVARVRNLADRHLEFRLQGVGDRDDLDDEVGVIGTVDDVTTAVMHTFQLEATAERDHLTGLANRRGLIRKLEAAVAVGGRTLVIFGDLDRFKQVNDAWGHTVGDRVLTAIGHRLRAAVRPGDLVGRWGGDEFVVVCDDVAPGDEAEVIDRLHGCLAECLVTDGNEFTASISLGAVRPEAGERGEDVLRRADNAMYETKRAHRRT